MEVIEMIKAAASVLVTLVGNVRTWHRERVNADVNAIVRTRATFEPTKRGVGSHIRVIWDNFGDKPVDVFNINARATASNSNGDTNMLVRFDSRWVTHPMFIGPKGSNEIVLDIIGANAISEEIAPDVLEILRDGTMQVRVSVEWDFRVRGESKTRSGWATHRFDAQRQEFDEVQQAA